MKTMKKLLVSLLIVAMLASLFSVGVLAAGGTITTDGSVEYTVYKMFSITQSGNDGKLYTAVDEWKNFSAPDYLTIDSTSGVVVWKKATSGTSTDAAAIAALASAYANKGTAVGTVTKGATLTIAEDGYYLLVGSDGTAGVVSIPDNNGATAWDVTSKTTTPGLPNVTKTVDGAETNSADRGAAMNFEIVITTNAGASNYKLYDIADDGLTINDDTIVITIGGTTLTKETDYTVADENNAFTIHFKDSALAGLNDGDKITVTYTGYLDNDAVAGVGEVNKAYLTHTAANAKTNEDTTTSTTYKIDAIKYGQDDDNPVLAGAEFVLKNAGDLYCKYNTATQKVEWVAEADADVIISDADGKFTFDGIAAGAYTLIETKAPAGYLISTAETGVNAGDTYNEAYKIYNKLADPLPETGGAGTTMFYVLGGILVVGAAAVLFARKRREEV